MIEETLPAEQVVGKRISHDLILIGPETGFKAARTNGIGIPSLLRGHPAFPPGGACRICPMEVAPGLLEVRPKAPPAIRPVSGEACPSYHRPVCRGYRVLLNPISGNSGASGTSK
ncbi:hypothetical protein [Aminivibrio sp.]|uniref:hypothetical protein n=1 Tax=Aminivibrio sp. TaxID=1872489 RepID=UPI001A40541E|nr:hypothetical protein [Aminivibrio sp.]MBL3540228.1 hypothetical protein [Aminivibrio sp.]